MRFKINIFILAILIFFLNISVSFEEKLDLKKRLVAQKRNTSNKYRKRQNEEDDLDNFLFKRNYDTSCSSDDDDEKCGITTVKIPIKKVVTVTTGKNKTIKVPVTKKLKVTIKLPKKITLTHKKKAINKKTITKKITIDNIPPNKTTTKKVTIKKIASKKKVIRKTVTEMTTKKVTVTKKTTVKCKVTCDEKKEKRDLNDRCSKSCESEVNMMAINCERYKEEAKEHCKAKSRTNNQISSDLLFIICVEEYCRKNSPLLCRATCKDQ